MLYTLPDRLLICISSVACFRRQMEHLLYSSKQIVSGMFAYGILALLQLAYTVKSVLTQYMLTSDLQVHGY